MRLFMKAGLHKKIIFPKLNILTIEEFSSIIELKDND